MKIFPFPFAINSWVNPRKRTSHKERKQAMKKNQRAPLCYFIRNFFPVPHIKAKTQDQRLKISIFGRRVVLQRDIYTSVVTPTEAVCKFITLCGWIVCSMRLIFIIFQLLIGFCLWICLLGNWLWIFLVLFFEKENTLTVCPS